MFEGWSEFFLLLGGASGALIGLLFVVTTLAATMRIGADTLSRGEALYMTPTLFHFVTVLLLSAGGTAPGMNGFVLALVAAPWALLGVGYCATTGMLVRTQRLPDSGHWNDVWCYGVLPAGLYLGLLLVAWGAWRDNPNTPIALAVALVALTILAIRNAWDLVVFIAPRIAA
jgi:hypothetical protein